MPGDRRFLIILSEYRYRRKSLYTSIVAGTVKLYRYNRNIVINVIVINEVECSKMKHQRRLRFTEKFPQSTLPETQVSRKHLTLDKSIEFPLNC